MTVYSNIHSDIWSVIFKALKKHEDFKIEGFHLFILFSLLTTQMYKENDKNMSVIFEALRNT